MRQSCQQTSGNDTFLTFCCRQAYQAEVGRANSNLRDYQQSLLDCMSTGNYIIAAPTMSGKTRIAVEVAGRILQLKHEAKIVFLAPTVDLSDQQAGKIQCILAPSESAIPLMCMDMYKTFTNSVLSRQLAFASSLDAFVTPAKQCL